MKTPTGTGCVVVWAAGGFPAGTAELPRDAHILTQIEYLCQIEYLWTRP